MSQEEILSKAIQEYVDNQQQRFNFYRNAQFFSVIVSGTALLLVVFSLFSNSIFGWKQECQTRQISTTESIQICRRS